jgi:hypothetical protein
MYLSEKDIVEFESSFNKALEVLKKFRKLLWKLADVRHKLCSVEFKLNANDYQASIDSRGITIRRNGKIVCHVDLYDARMFDLRDAIENADAFLEVLEADISKKEKAVKELRALFDELKEALKPAAVRKRLSN